MLFEFVKISKDTSHNCWLR